MRLYIKIANRNGSFKAEGLDKIFEFNRSNRWIFVNSKEASFRLSLDKYRFVYLFGDIFYHIKGNGGTKLIDSRSAGYLKELFAKNDLQGIISSLEGQYIGIYLDNERKKAHIFSDLYARVDCFYASSGSNFYFSTDLDHIFKNINPQYDNKMIAHLFCVYGWYTPKGRTIYSNVRRLKVGEIATISGSGVMFDTIRFKPRRIKNYSESDLDSYEKILRHSVIARANISGKTWISSSSGWDSSILLGLLVDEYGSKNVGMITGSMEYSKNSKLINLFEIDKIKKIASFFGIKPEFVKFDFKSKKVPRYWKKVLPYYRSRHVYTYVSYNFAKLSDKLYDIAGKGQVIFNGETSDSFHNFGFSQFATFFHTQKSFTEYADKMNCYLYGPSFFKKVIDNIYDKDRVFQIFTKMRDDVEFCSSISRKKDRIEAYLFPFFYGTPRIPFARTYRNKVLTHLGEKELYRCPFRECFPHVLFASHENLYSWLIYLYHSFHSQGSTVNVMKYSMEYNGHKWRSPFNDYRLINFLSVAPERWGRGLELNNTKFPLKWVAKNKLNFPYQLLDTGPHSYLYDVIEGFSLYAEMTYRSGATEFFKDTLSDRKYQKLFNDQYINIDYLDRLVDDFLDGKETKGVDFNNLVSLITLCVTGWY